MTNSYTFLKLIEKYHVEIPLLQRDYAQGRKKSEDKKVPEVRKRLIESLFNSLKENKKFELDFIYGPVLNDTFIPLDGQQRLTTLFLLYWYVEKREREKDNICQELCKFTYKVRTTTQEFLNALLKETIDFEPLGAKATIKDAAWYYSSWDMDNSVQGMLTMIDAIDQQYGVKKQDLWRRLENINFHLLNMEEYELSDDLYMKMNARGIPLTDFENFKAWLELEQQLGDFSFQSGCNWQQSMDQEWTDLFWNICDQDASKFDTAFLRFFKAVALNSYAAGISENIDPGNKDSDDKKKKRDNISRLNKDEDYVPVEEYQSTYNLLEKETIDAAFNMLKNLSSLSSLSSSDREVFSEKEFLIEQLCEKMFTYTEQVQFYGMFLWLGQKNAKMSDKFDEWMRVVRNLALNSGINRPAAFVRALRGLKEIDKALENEKMAEADEKDVLHYLIKKEAEDITGFRREQVEEEIHKAILYLSKGGGWGDALKKYEKHPLFTGQIGFLLKKSGDDFSSWLSNDQLEVFQSRGNYAEKLWDKDGSVFDKENNLLLFRALIASGHLTIPEDGIDLTNTKDNWRILLRKEKELRQAILFLLDQEFCEKKVKRDKADIKDVLGKIVGSIGKDHNLYQFILWDEKAPYAECKHHLYVQCQGGLYNGVLNLKTSKYAWKYSWFVSQNRDNLILEILKNKNLEEAVFVDPVSREAVSIDWNSLDSAGCLFENQCLEQFLKEKIIIGFPFEHLKGKAYIAYETDGLTHKMGVLKDHEASREKFEEMTGLVNTHKKGLEEKWGVTTGEEYWWYACKAIEKLDDSKIGDDLKELKKYLEQKAKPTPDVQ